jgi:hypothetical protein
MAGSDLLVIESSLDECLVPCQKRRTEGVLLEELDADILA